jgi:hypothetical protein
MKRILEAVMRHTIAPRQPLPLPTGSNPMLPLDAFSITKQDYSLTLKTVHGHYAIEIDPQREVGFFEQVGGAYHGKFWLADGVFLGTDHLLPREVQQGLARLQIEVA